jgi:hypothetical protein
MATTHTHVCVCVCVTLITEILERSISAQTASSSINETTLQSTRRIFIDKRYIFTLTVTK